MARRDTQRLRVGAGTLCLHAGSSSHLGLRSLPNVHGFVISFRGPLALGDRPYKARLCPAGPAAHPPLESEDKSVQAVPLRSPTHSVARVHTGNIFRLRDDRLRIFYIARYGRLTSK
jgi:hypothetical protein